MQPLRSKRDVDRDEVALRYAATRTYGNPMGMSLWYKTFALWVDAAIIATKRYLPHTRHLMLRHYTPFKLQADAHFLNHPAF